MAKKSLADYRDAIAVAGEVYTHVVLTRDGRQFSIHYDEKTALERASQIGGTVEQFTPHMTEYWNTDGAPHYDH